MNYAEIKNVDVANGPGIRISFFVSGCPHHCKGCFNQDTWDYNYGKPFTEETIEYIIKLMKPDYIRGLTVLGGEPMAPPNQAGILELLKKVRVEYPEKSIWLFTGYLYDKDILEKMVPTLPETKQILELLDIMVDGPFIEEQKNLNLKFKGSENQRTINVQESLSRNEIILWDEISNI